MQLMRHLSLFQTVCVGFSLLTPCIVGAAQNEGLRRSEAVATPAPKVGGSIKKHVAAPSVSEVMKPPAPTGMKSTLDPKECASHAPAVFGGLVCDAAIKDGHLVLVWRWDGNRDIDGYRIYRVNGNQRQQAALQASGKDWTVYTMSQPESGFEGQCFAVTALAGAYESDLSGSYCVGGRATISTKSMKPTHVRSVYRLRARDKGLVSDFDKTYTETSAELKVGYTYTTRKYPLGDKSLAGVDRAALYFDVDPIRGKNVYVARLKLRVGTTVIDKVVYESVVDHTTSCLARIGMADSYWWTHEDWIDGGVVLTPGIAVGPDVSVDVTKIVAQWVEGGAPNYGFLLLGAEENFSAFTEQACHTTYSDVTLEVHYY